MNKNEYYLFVCNSGEIRSPDAARIAKEDLARLGKPLVDTDFAGLNNRQIMREKLPMATRVFVMEDYMRGLIQKRHHYRGKIACLNIPEELSYDRAALEDKLRDVLPEMLFR